MFDIDFIIPCYGKSELINRGLASVATQWKKEFIHVTLVNDCSPNTDCNYQDLVDRYKDQIDIRVITMPENSGQGLTRQFGIDNTTHDWFMFMDEDDQLGNGIAVSQFVGAVESYIYELDGNIYVTDENGERILKKNQPNLALVSGPLFEFDDNHTHVIESTNQVWLNSKLYNRKFFEKHNIRFNKAQSRHAEDYYWTSCFFYCLDHDKDYSAILLDNQGLYYLWYPNEKSQSRVDPHYGFMLAGYTMNGSVNILKYIKNCKTIEFDEWAEQDFYHKLLNMTVYSYYTFQAFINHVKTTDYVPKLELDWTLLRDSCKWLRNLTKKHYKRYTYMQVISELVHVKEHSDVQYTEPWYKFDDYINGKVEEFEWDLDKLLKIKEQ